MTIALGTPVTYHHRAAVARLEKKAISLPGDEETRRTWSLREGVSKGEMKPGEFGDFLVDMFCWRPLQVARPGSKELVNKTVMIWPEEGSGVVTGRVRRQKGVSTSPSGGGGMYDDSYDDGYFWAIQTFRLYVVRHVLDGQGYVLIPEWACAPVRHD